MSACECASGRTEFVTSNYYRPEPVSVMNFEQSRCSEQSGRYVQSGCYVQSRCVTYSVGVMYRVVEQ